MKTALVIGSMLISLLSLSASPDDANAGDHEVRIDVRVDPAVELFCTIHRLAETHQYTRNDLPKYIKEIDDHFGPFRDHAAVKLAVEMRGTRRISGSAPMALAVYLEEPPALEPRSTLDPPPGDLDPRWKPDCVAGFREAASAFARDSRFMEFFASRGEFYAESVQSLEKCLEKENVLPWFRGYFGSEPRKYTIIVGMQNGRGHYGLTITHRDGAREYISIIGASSPSWWSGVPRFSFDWFAPTVVHEFCHSYINPLVDAHDGLLRDSGEIMYPHHRDKLIKQGYSSYRIMLHEYLVRACVIRYLHSKKDIKGIEHRIEVDEGQGFPEVRGLADLLGEYEADRERYGTLSDFMPRIADYFDESAASMK